MDNLNPQPTKQNYHKPELLTYGTVRLLTNSLGRNGASDGASDASGKNFTKT